MLDRDMQRMGNFCPYSISRLAYYMYARKNIIIKLIAVENIIAGVNFATSKDTGTVINNCKQFNFHAGVNTQILPYFRN
jgi:hypothetical protein